MVELRLQHLPADVLGLPEFARRLLAARPVWDALPELLVPAHIRDVPEPLDCLSPDEREELSRTLEQRSVALAPHVRVLDAIRSLREPGTATVVCSLAPRFLGGPLEQLHAAAHTVRLATALSEAWRRPVVPLAWLRDDPEVGQRAYLLNENLDLERIGLPGLGGSATSPFQRILRNQPQRLGALRARLRELLADREHAEAALELCFPRDGESLGRAFARALSDLLGAAGLIVVEPNGLRPLASRALASILGTDPRGALRAGREELRASSPALGGADWAWDASDRIYALDGFQERAEVGAPGTLRALREGGEGFCYDGESGSRTVAELAAEVVQEPTRFGAGACLLPLVQELVLPIAAHVGTWDDVGLHSCLGPLRRRQLPPRPRPAFVPRLSATWLDPEVEHSLAKLELGVGEALESLAAEVREAPEPADPLPRAQPDAALTPVAEALRAAIERAHAELQGARGPLGALDRGLSLQLKRDAERVRELLGKLARRVERLERNRTGKSERHRRRLRQTLFPDAAPQEERTTWLALIARHGPEAPLALAREIEACPSEHVVVRRAEAESAI